jgi:adenosylhomocysteine nucleosidase
MIAIVAAMRDEVASFLDAGGYRESERHGPVRLYTTTRWPEVAVVIGGAGRKRAEAATRVAIERCRPDAIVSAGFAGGVSPGLSVGDVVLCDEIRTIDGSTAGELPRNTEDGLFTIAGDLQRVGCLTVKEMASTSEDKRSLGNRFPVAVVDMESYWVAEIATQAGVQSVVVRCVLDPVERTLPPLVEHLIGSGAVARLLRSLAYVVTRPMFIPDLLRLARETAKAKKALARTLESIASTPWPQAEKEDAIGAVYARR